MFILNQVAQAVEFMHEQKVTHRDIKPDNIFIKDSMVKLGDFGVSKRLEGLG